MTAPTIGHPPPPPTAPPPGRPRPRPPHRSRRRATSTTMLAIAELTLVAVTTAAAIGLGRLFADGSFLVPVVGFTLLGHAVAAACRRNGLSALTTAAVGIGTLVLAITWALLPETATFGLPTLRTLDAVLADLSSALATFREVVAPAPVEPGFVLAAAIGVWIVAFTADTAAFRAGAPLEAIVPSATLFVFAAALGAPQGRLVITVAFLLALLAHWLAHRALHQASSPTWMTTEDGGGPTSMLRAGAVLALTAVAAAVLVGPRIPGAGDPGVVPWRASERDGPGSLVVVSPLVDIRARIVDQADVEVFTVDSAERSYWRLTSLETFDGRIWSSKGQYRPARGRLEGTGAAPLGGTGLSVQHFRISQLDVKWLPAAYEPVEIGLASARYDPESGSLLTEEEVATGLEYSVTSALKTIEGAELQAVAELAEGELDEGYTDLPDGFSLRAQQLASEIAGAPSLSPYERAIALQDYFRGGTFTYDLSIDAGHDDNALEQFLFETRRGYCEQFAGAYAALARSVGLPARVAVGFTPGERGDDGRFEVRGLNGHAWPEVYFAGYGWVPFEPTPGRGIPGGESYTGVEEQQAVPEAPETATTLPPTTTTVAGEQPAGTTTLPEIFAPDMVDDQPSSSGDGFLARWAPRLLAGLAIALGVTAAWAALLLVVGTLRRGRRRTAATSAADRVRVAWTEAVESLGRKGLTHKASETPLEYAGRVAAAGAVDAATITELAHATTAATFADGLVAEEAADRADTQSRQLVESMRASADWRTRLRWALDPRPYLPNRASRMEVRDTTPPASGLGATPLS
jgi:transglutaminase-like putative cysteine protease